MALAPRRITNHILLLIKASNGSPSDGFSFSRLFALNSDTEKTSTSDEYGQKAIHYYLFSFHFSAFRER